MLSESSENGKVLSTFNSSVAIHTSTSASGRIAWIDAARGLLIILVVAGHAIIGIVEAGLEKKGGLLSDINFYIYTFHMPAFFFLSGLLARPSVYKDSRRFFYNITKHIAYPYFLWGTIQMLIMNLFSNYLNNPAPFNPLEFFNLILGSPSQFWFLKVLFLIHVAYLLSVKYSSEYWFLLASIVLLCCARLFPLPIEMSKFATSAIFYALGVMFAKGSIAFPSHSRFPLIWVGLLGLLWLFFAAAAQKEHIPALGGREIAGLLPAAIAGSFFVFALSGLKYIGNRTLLLYLGQRTLAIFCLHILFVAGTRIVLAKVFGVTSVAVILPAVILAGVAGPLVIAAIAERFQLRAALGLR
ncbi:MAG: acyltransferase family protein [Beijerinckiaceae bacterium]|nr:acyltransferase family protein [Beijerinckiaceae bacterium]